MPVNVSITWDRTRTLRFHTAQVISVSRSCAPILAPNAVQPSDGAGSFAGISPTRREIVRIVTKKQVRNFVKCTHNNTSPGVLGSAQRRTSRPSKEREDGCFIRTETTYSAADVTLSHAIAMTLWDRLNDRSHPNRWSQMSDDHILSRLEHMVNCFRWRCDLRLEDLSE